MALDSKTVISISNKRSTPYTASLRNGEYYEWLPSKDSFEDSIDLAFRDVQYLHTTSSTFKEGYLFVDNEEARQRLGLEKEEIKVNTLSREEVEKALGGNLVQMKKALGKITNQTLLREIVQIAKELKVENINKLQYLSEISGVPFEVITEQE